jgi:hypothetical protein
MSFNQVGDVFVPELVEEPLQGMFAGMTVMRKTGAGIFKTGMPAGKAELGQLIKVPYFNTIGELEELADGQALSPRNIKDSIELAPVRHAGIAIEATWWAQASAMKDPYQEMARQIGVAVERFADKVLLDAASAPASVSNDVLTLDSYSVDNTRTIDYDMVVDAKFLWGDEQEEIAAMVMHSKVKGDCYKIKDSQGHPLLVPATDGSLDRFVGLPTIPSDRLAPTSDTPPKYTTLGLKSGSLVFWMAGAPRILTAQDAMADSNAMALHIYFAVHRYKRMPSGTKPGVFRMLHA